MKVTRIEAEKTEMNPKDFFENLKNLETIVENTEESSKFNQKVENSKTIPMIAVEIRDSLSICERELSQISPKIYEWINRV